MKNKVKSTLIFRRKDDGTEHIFDRPIDPTRSNIGVHFVRKTNRSPDILNIHLDIINPDGTVAKHEKLEDYNMGSGMGVIFAVSGTDIASTIYEEETKVLDIYRSDDKFKIKTDKGGQISITGSPFTINFQSPPYKEVITLKDELIIKIKKSGSDVWKTRT